MELGIIQDLMNLDTTILLIKGSPSTTSRFQTLIDLFLNPVRHVKFSAMGDTTLFHVILYH